MRLRVAVPPPDLPDAGLRVPGAAVRAALILAGVLLSLLDFGLSGWLGCGVVLSVVAAWRPRSLFGWALIVFLALGQLAHDPDLSWRFLVLLAGLHLLHVLSMQALELPARSWMQPAILTPSLQRFLAIQVPAQLIAVVALLLLAPGHNHHRPLTLAGFAMVGVLGLLGIGLLLFAPLMGTGDAAGSGHGEPDRP